MTTTANPWHPQAVDSFPVDEGQVTLSFPSKMSAASYGDMIAMLELSIAKLRRWRDREQAAESLVFSWSGVATSG